MDKKSWKEKFQDKLKERKDSFSTSSGIDVDRFFTINDIDKLYTEDSKFHSDNYTSLDSAFSLKQVNQEIDNRTFEEKLHDENKKVPLTKRKYLNPANDKLVGYARARALGII